MKKSNSSRKRKVAIFDIDGTIFRSSLLIEVTEALVQEGLFPIEARNIYAKAYENWANRKDSYDKYIYAVIRAFEKYIKTVKQSDFKKVAKKVMAFHGKRVYRFTRDLVKDLKDKKYYLLAISHSPRELVELFAKNLGFDKVYGRVYEIDSKGQFTGQTLYENLISDKAKILHRALEKENLPLQGSIGVGDSEGDITLLKIVSRPICFNPNSKLYREAKKNGWEIVVERKDVIYKI
jgi:HAD superfamily hydrolase (TIGR01490 family)